MTTSKERDVYFLHDRSWLSLLPTLKGEMQVKPSFNSNVHNRRGTSYLGQTKGVPLVGKAKNVWSGKTKVLFKLKGLLLLLLVGQKKMVHCVHVVQVLLCFFFSEISEALEDCWPLEESQRKKIIKRLLLKWHPDKNIGEQGPVLLDSYNVYIGMITLACLC